MFNNILMSVTANYSLAVPSLFLEILSFFFFQMCLDVLKATALHTLITLKQYFEITFVTMLYTKLMFLNANCFPS